MGDFQPSHTRKEGWIFCASCPEKFLALGPILLASCQGEGARSSRNLKEGRRHHARGGIWGIFTCFWVLCLINEISEGEGARITTSFLSGQVSPAHDSEIESTFLLPVTFRDARFEVFSSCQRKKHIIWD